MSEEPLIFLVAYVEKLAARNSSALIRFLTCQVIKSDSMDVSLTPRSAHARRTLMGMES